MSYHVVNVLFVIYSFLVPTKIVDLFPNIKYFTTESISQKAQVEIVGGSVSKESYFYYSVRCRCVCSNNGPEGA